MASRILLILLAALVVEWAAFRYAHRDLLWFDRPAAAHAALDVTRDTALETLSRPQVSRRHLEALARATDRDGLRDVHLATLTRMAEAYPEDVDVLLRAADALRLHGEYDKAADLFARVAEAR